VLEHGKHYFTDKPPMTTLGQLAQARAATDATGKKYAVYYSERLHVESAVYAGQLIADALTADEVAKPRTIDPQSPIECLDLDAARNVIIDLGNLVYTAGDNWRSWSEYFETLTEGARQGLCGNEIQVVRRGVIFRNGAKLTTLE